LAYDFRFRFRLSLSEIGQGVPYGEALALVQQLGLEQGSHFFMSASGWDYPMDAATMYTAALTVTVKNMLLAEGEKPATVKWPWPDTDAPEDVTPEERAVLQARLQSSSAFAQLRTKE
jgi:hypothetical protein